MSADNGIYIVKFPEGFRVVHAQCIENIDYYPEGTKERKEMLKDYFGQSEIYETREEALNQASKIYDDITNSDFPILEYGICFLGEYESFE